MKGTISLELKLISCRDLKAFNFFQKLSIQAVVSVFNEELNTTEQRQKSPVDRKGGRNPEWNHPMEFKFNLGDAIPDGLCLIFEFRKEGVNLFNYRTIGEAKVPLKDLIDGASDHFNGMVMRFVSYQVKASNGKANGVLNFAYKVKGKVYKEGIVSTNAPVSPPRKNIDISPRKFVSYRSLEIDVRSGETGRLYPCLDDVGSPLSGTRYVDLPTSQLCTTPPPTTVLGAGNGTYGCSYPLPTVQTPGRYCCNTSKAATGSRYSYYRNSPGGWTFKNW